MQYAKASGKKVQKAKKIAIPAAVTVNGEKYQVTAIAPNAFKNNKSLKSVTIGRNVTVIGTNAFYGCGNLSRVSGGNAIVKIGDKAFANCSSLTGITFSGTVRSIGKQAFYNCKKLRSITIKTSTLSGKTVGSKAFAGTCWKHLTKREKCSKIKKIGECSPRFVRLAFRGGFPQDTERSRSRC